MIEDIITTAIIIYAIAFSIYGIYVLIKEFTGFNIGGRRMKVYAIECIDTNDAITTLGYFTDMSKAVKYVEKHEEWCKATGKYLGVHELKCLNEDQAEEPNSVPRIMHLKMNSASKDDAINKCDDEDDLIEKLIEKQSDYLKKLDKFEAILMKDQTTRKPFIGIHEKESGFVLNSKVDPNYVPDFDPNKSYNVYLSKCAEKGADYLYIKINNYFAGPIFIPIDAMHKFVD